MTATVTLRRAGPATTVQDTGRPGQIARGLSPGGAADPRALYEAAALLGLPAPVAALEMVGFGVAVTADAPVRLALTGAPMRATQDGAALAWNAAHWLQPGQTLDIGGALSGTYGYLTFAGGMDLPQVLDSPAAHLAAGLGGLLADGARLRLGADPRPDLPARTLAPDDRFAGGRVRIMPGPQTALFDADTRARFAATRFARAPRANRQGVQLDQDGAPFAARPLDGPLASDFVTAGDVQMTGAGVPFVLLTECQTVGGYPRIGTVLAEDLPRVAQAPAGAALHFTWVDVETADRTFLSPARILAALREPVRPLVRDPRDMPDLLGYQLIGGVTPGDDLERG